MIGIILQARMGSTRLPGKVLKEVNGQPLLSYQLARISKCKRIDKIVVATSLNPIDDAIVDICEKINIPCFRGDENDVLSRYYECAKKYKLSTIVRLTGDCPLIDPSIVDKIVMKFKTDNVDYCSNTIPPQTSSYPDGTDVEIFSMHALSKSHQECQDKTFREHVTFYMWKTSKFLTSQMEHKENISNYRLTVDYKEDLDVINLIDNYLRQNNEFGSLESIIKFLKNNKKVRDMNSKYKVGDGWKLDE